MAVDVKVAAVKQCDVSYVQQAQMTHDDVPIKDTQGYMSDRPETQHDAQPV